MKQIASFFILCLCYFSLGPSAFAEAPTSRSVGYKPESVRWEKLSDEDGVEVHRGVVDNSDFVAFRGTTVMDAPIERIATVLSDTNHMLEWMKNGVELKDVEVISPFDRILYNRIKGAKALFIRLVHDRDFVFKSHVEVQKEKRELDVTIHSIDDPRTPPLEEKEGYVRGEIKHGSYVIRSLPDNLEKTLVTIELHVDPKGSVGAGIVNYFQKAWPKDTLNGIAQSAKKPWAVPFPGLREYFDGKLSMSECLELWKKAKAAIRN